MKREKRARRKMTAKGMTLKVVLRMSKMSGDER
jgi:hypothetical protein